MTTDTQASERERLQGQLAQHQKKLARFLREQEQLERSRHVVLFLLLPMFLTPPLGLFWGVGAAFGIFFAWTVFFFVGLYLSWGHRREAQARVDDARRRVRQLKNALDDLAA